jgi:hypothetical protein
MEAVASSEGLRECVADIAVVEGLLTVGIAGEGIVGDEVGEEAKCAARVGTMAARGTARRVQVEGRGSGVRVLGRAGQGSGPWAAGVLKWVRWSGEAEREGMGRGFGGKGRGEGEGEDAGTAR